MHPEKFEEKNHFVKDQNGRQSAIIHFHMAVSW